MQNDDVSVTDWVVTLIVLSIPFVNIIMFIYWIFSSSTKPSKKNFMLASLVLMLLAFALAFLLVMFGGTSMMNSLR